MAATAWFMLRWFPLLAREQQAHRDSLPLDGLRGILASSVLFHHASIWFDYERTGLWQDPASPLYAQIGPAAVTMFFFVSGYLFWDMALRRPDRITWRRLLPNRVRRIVPGYWAAAVLILLSAMCVSRFRLRESVGTVTEESLEWLMGGFPHLAEANYNGVSGVTLSGGVFWTLRMEWIFYALLPVLFWLRKGWRLLFSIAVLAILIGFRNVLAKVHVSHTVGILALSRHFVHMFLVGFSFGIIAAYRPWGERIRNWMLSPWAAVLATACCCAELALSKRIYTLQQSLLLVPAFFLVVVGNDFGGLLSSRALRALGQISYSLYIFHGILLFILLTIWNRYDAIAGMNRLSYASLIWAIGVAAVCLCTLSYWYIERPFTAQTFRRE